MADQPPSLPPQRPRAPMPTLMDEETTSTRLGTLRVRDRAVLTQMTGLEAGRVCEIAIAEATFGRSTECTHAFDEASLSRVHARLAKEGGAYVLYDLGSRNGIFVNDAKVEKHTLHDGDRVRLGTAVTLRFQLVDEQEKQTLVRVFESSVKDGLTGAWNRKYLDERLRGEVAFATRHRTAFSIVMTDIDHFKKINDTYGHPAGDEVLRVTSALMRAAIRTEDILGRYGGEEFVVVARGADLKAAVQLAERLRVIIERRPVEADGVTIARTISAGAASLECCGPEPTVEKLVSIADDRLYRAKEGGRNRVCGA